MLWCLTLYNCHGVPSLCGLLDTVRTIVLTELYTYQYGNEFEYGKFKLQSWNLMSMSICPLICMFLLYVKCDSKIRIRDFGFKYSCWCSAQHYGEGFRSFDVWVSLEFFEH